MYFERVLRRLIRLLRLSASRVRLRLKTQNNSRGQMEWFPFDKSCQIPNLSRIFEQIFGREFCGVLVEVGAFDGVTFSNSSGLLDRGWSGLLIEPVPEFAEKCKERHVNSPNVRVVNKAISNRSGTETLFLAGALSTLSQKIFAEYKGLEWSSSSITEKSISVEMITLNQLLENEKINHCFDLLIVDVEGFEKEVFEGFYLQKWNTRVVIIELSDFHPTLQSHKKEHYDIGKILVKCGYSVIFKDATNTIFVQTHILDQLFAVTQ